MTSATAKRGKITDENLDEAARLLAIWNRTKADRALRGVASQERFGAEFGIGNQAAVGFFLNGRTALSPKAAAGFARGLRCSVAEFSPRLARVLDVAPAWTAEQHPSGGTQAGEAAPSVAQVLSHPMQMIDPIPIAWESKVSGDLPELFRVVAPDDAMAPGIRKGHEVILSTAELPARPDDVVLLADKDGNWMLRRYALIRPGHWLAEATGAGYRPLDSVEHGLEVLAIKMGIWGRSG